MPSILPTYTRKNSGLRSPPAAERQSFFEAPADGSAPVLIIGGGLTGLYLALLLVRDGIRPRIIDKETQYQQGSRACDIQVRTAEYLHLLGLIPEIDRLGQRQGGLRRRDEDPEENMDSWEVVDRDSDPNGSSTVEPRTLSQSLHEDVIRAELAKYGCRVELGKTLRSFTQDELGVNAEVAVYSAVPDKEEQVETIRAQYLAAADGPSGIARKQLECKYFGQRKQADPVLFCDAPVKGLRSHIWSTRLKENGSVRFSGRQLRDSPELFSIAITTPNSPADVAKLDLKPPGSIQKLFTEASNRKNITIEDPIWFAHYRSDEYLVNKFVVDRVFILGDAAHGLPCTGGQRMNASIQDATNLYWKLSLVIKNLAPTDLLSTYEDERLPVVGMMLNKPTDRRPANKIAETVEPPSSVLSAEDKALAMLGVNYRWSSIVLDTRTPTRATKEDMQRRAYTGFSSSLVAGDRAPNANALATVRTGVSTALYSIFDLRQHTVLLFKSAATATDITPALNMLKNYPTGTVQTVVLSRRPLDTKVKTDYVLSDSQGHAFNAYMVRGDQLTIVIVRPDTYIGAIVRTPEKMYDYFSKIFLPVGLR